MRRILPAVVFLLLAGALRAQDGARYLIITHDNFVQAIQPLAQWKTQKGMLAKVVPLSVTGSSATQIRAYIQNAYNTWPIRPEYVLVVGAPNLLPPSLNTPPFDGTDDAYGDMSGSYQVEIPVGRFFCNNPAECSTLVTKSLTYEKTPYASGDSTWMQRGTTIIREDDPPDRHYQADCRYVRGLWSGAGFVQTESLISPADSSTDVRNAINAGRGLVLFRGRAVYHWWTPFDRVWPYTLTNGAKLPVVVSGTCITMTLYPGRTVQADSFVRAGTAQTLRGAVAYFGTTSFGEPITIQRSTVSKGFFTAIFAEGRYKLGDACKRAKFYLDSLLPGDRQYYQEWNLLGDPELNVWTTVPQPMAADYDTLIPVGPDSFDVTVTSSGAPVANALVCIQTNSGIYQYGYTDVSGQRSFSINDSVEEMMDVTVTARNCVPYEGQAEIYNPAGVITRLVPRRMAQMVLTVNPNPGRARFTVVAQPGAQVSIHSSDGRLVWTGSVPATGALSWDASNVPAGIYLVRSVNGAGATVRRMLQVVR